MARAFRKMLLDLAPDERSVEQHIGTMRRMNRRTVEPQRLLRIHHEGQRFIGDANFLRSVLRKRAVIGNHRYDPFAGIACLPHRERMTPDLRRIKPVHQRIGRGGKLIAS